MNRTDTDRAEKEIYLLTKYYIRNIFTLETNLLLRNVLNDIIKDQTKSQIVFNEFVIQANVLSKKLESSNE